MQSFEKISKMNLADLDRPEMTENLEPADITEREEEQPKDSETVTVADVEGTSMAEDTDVSMTTEEKKHMRQPEGQHYYLDAKIGEKELLAFLFGHNYRQPLMIVTSLIAVIWPIMIIVRNDSNMMLAIALAAIVLLALPLSTWSRGKKAAKTNPSYQKTFHYMVDEWGLHLELGEECIDLEWNKVYKCMFLKSVTVIYTGKVNAFLIPTAAMGEKTEEINAFIKKMKAK